MGEAVATERAAGEGAAAPMRGRLGGIRLLRSLPPAELQRLEQRCAWRRYRAGEQVLDRACRTRDVLFIASGSLRVVNYSAGGREVAYAVVEAGGLVGELAALDGQSRTATVVAATACEIGALPAELFHDLLHRHAAVAVDLLIHLTRIIRIGDERIAELSTVGAVQRVYRELLRRARADPADPRSWIVAPLPTQHDIASQIGATRETVARALGQLVGAGIVQRRGRTLVILDRAALAALANPDGDEAP
jgi:CRP-like cAMP-binding protein